MDIDPLLDRSRASDAFKADVRAYLANRAAAAITTARHAPTVKVARVVAQLLDAEPALAIERIHIDAHSGCSDFDGTLRVGTPDGEMEYRFVWCCHWRAQQEGWVDWFGLPDQMRAAREFGWRCFKRWELAGARSTREPALA